MRKPIEEVQSEGYHYNSQKPMMDYPCIVCGRECKNPKWGVWLVDGGGSIATLDETENPASDLGMYPIGNDCKRNRPDLAPFVFRVLGK